MRDHVRDFRTLLEGLDENFYQSVSRAAETIRDSMRNGGKVLAFGNGGSSADASHFAAEFVGRYLRERKALPAISLSAEVASVTAIGNDYGFEHVFSRQIEAFGVKGDVAIGISTSGKSPNVISALKRANELGLRTVAFVGAAGLGEPCAENIISVPSRKTFEIQEVHKIALHSICDSVERAFVDKAQ